MASQTVAVIGGGPAGLRAAQTVAALGGSALLIERRDFLGGTPVAESYAGLTPRGEPARPMIAALTSTVISDPGVDVRLGTEVTAAEGGPGAFTLTLRGPAGEERAEAGAVIIATGFSHFDPGRETQMYGYYEFPDVVTLPDLEAMLSAGELVRPSDGTPPARVCFIQCVGSRDRQIGNEYCSKVCCGVASKLAIEIRQALPDSKVWVFYIDIRTYGYWENELYWPAQELHHVQYVKGLISEVLPKGDHLLVRGEDTTMGRPMELDMDLVVLSTGMEPSAGTRQACQLLGVRQNRFGFADAPGSPLDPVTTSQEGVFACGAALGPADLEDTVATGSAAGAWAVGYLRRQGERVPR